MTRAVRIYSLNNVPIGLAVFLAGVIILYMTSLVLIYLVNGNLCLLTTFLQFFLPQLFNLCQHFTWKSFHTYRELKTFHILTIQILLLTCYCQSLTASITSVLFWGCVWESVADISVLPLKYISI